MTNEIVRTAVVLGEIGEVALVAKATAVLILGLLAARLVGRASMAVRALVLASTFTVLALLPAAAVLSPPIVVPVPSPPTASFQPEKAGLDDNVLAGRQAAPLDLDAAMVESAVAARATPPLFHVGTTARMLWMVGVAIFFAPVVAIVWRLQNIRRSGIRWGAGESLARQLSAQAGVHRSIAVLRHEAVRVPMTCGFLRPVILLPWDAPVCSKDDVERALVHEIEHVRRGDWPVQILVRLVCSLYWFHPLVWVAWRQLHLSTERACDDAVLRRQEAAPYAAQLVQLAEQLSRRESRPIVAMASRSDLATRVAALLDGHEPRDRAGARATVAALCIAALTVSVIAPLTARQAPAFDVASVKRSAPSGGLGAFPRVVAQPGGRWIARNAPLVFILWTIYPVQRPNHIIGGPSWIRTEPFDIEARAGNPNASADEIQLMARRLLAERFDLGVHVEQRAVDVYALVRATSRGLGPGLGPAVECQRSDGSHGSFVPGEPEPGELPYCEFQSQLEGGMSRLSAAGVPVSTLVQRIQSRPDIDRPIVDRTGLTGTFAIELEEAMRTRGSQPAPGTLSADIVGPSLFVALEEQLGLRLEPSTAVMDVLVIKRVEMPEPD